MTFYSPFRNPRLASAPPKAQSAIALPLAHSPWTPILALDRLNSWIRAELPFCWFVRSAFKPVIYWTKTQAILDMSRRVHIGLRRVVVEKPCVSCLGTGTFVPYYLLNSQTRGEPCWTCQATGTATLRFIESQIGPVRWHTPARNWYMSSLDTYLPFRSYYEQRDHGGRHYESANGWEPNSPGRTLSRAEVERDLLIVLHEWPQEVCFSIEFHHRAGVEKQWRFPDVPKAEEWIKAKIGNLKAET